MGPPEVLIVWTHSTLWLWVIQSRNVELMANSSLNGKLKLSGPGVGERRLWLRLYRSPGSPQAQGYRLPGSSQPRQEHS